MKTKLLLKLLFILSCTITPKLYQSQTLINENFSTFPPANWTVTNTNPNTNNNWNGGPSIGAYLWTGDTNSQNEWLITPTLDLSGYNKMFLTIRPRFYYKSAIQNDYYDLILLVSENGGSSWTELWKDDSMPLDLIPQSSNPVTSTYKSFNISNYTGTGKTNIKFALALVAPAYPNWDTVNNSPVQNYNFIISADCPNIDAFSNYGYNGSTDSKIIWQPIEGFSGTYDIEYGSIDFVQGSGTMITGITGNSYTLPANSCGISYFIRTNCGGTQGAWTTRRVLTIPYNHSIDTSSNTATITFPDSDTAFDIEYGPKNFVSGGGILIENITTPTYTLSNLFNCIDYDIRLRRNCGGNKGIWTGSRIYINSSNNLPTDPNYFQTFDNNLCATGFYPFSGNVTSGSSNSNSLLLLNDSSNGVALVNSRGVNLIAGNTYKISFQAKQYSASTTNLYFRISSFKMSSGIVYQTFAPGANFSEFSYQFIPTSSGTYYFGLQNSNTTIGRGIYIDNFEVTTIVLGNQEVEKTNVKIYPNPAQDFITLESANQKIQSVKIYDISGKLVKTEKRNTSSKQEINIQNLKNGIYMVELQTDKGTQSYKIIKK